jgi:hypothetical protein
MNFIPYEFVNLKLKKQTLKFFKQNYKRVYTIDKQGNSDLINELIELNILKHGGTKDKDKEKNKDFKIIKTKQLDYEEDVKWCDRGGLYIFKVKVFSEDNNEGTNISVINVQDDTSCVIVNIPSKKKGLCIIKSIGIDKYCGVFYDVLDFKGMPERGGGDILFRFIINFLISNDIKFNITKIVLTDISRKACLNCSETINLSHLRMVTNGKPWYMKYGFLFYNEKENDFDLDAYKKYKMNHKILKTFIIPKKHLVGIYAMLDYHEKIDKNVMQEAKEIINKYEYFYMAIQKLTENFKQNCCIIKYCLDYLYKEGVFKVSEVIKQTLYSLYRQNYYLNTKNTFDDIRLLEKYKDVFN